MRTERVFGLADTKRAILSNGGNNLDIAVAMLETKHMSTRDYLYGDVDANNNPKTHDRANFGILKQNWLMIRSVINTANANVKGFTPLTANDWNQGANLNGNLRADIQMLHDSQRLFGNQWFAGHRNGQTGLNNPNTPDINNYMNTVLIKQEIDANPKYRTDNTRVYRYVPRKLLTAVRS